MTDRERLERDIVALIMNQPKAFYVLKRALRVDLFESRLCRRLMEAIHACAEAGQELNHLNVGLIGRLTNREMADFVEIGERAGSLPMLTKMLAECVGKQALLSLKQSLHEEDDFFQMLDNVCATESKVRDLVLANSRKDKLTLLEEYQEGLLRAAEGRRPQRIPTGIPSVDGLLDGGLELGGLTLLGGVPGMGKTSFMLNVALHAAQAGFGVGFIEGEMTSDEILQRLNGIDTGRRIRDIRKGKQFDEMSKDFIAYLFTLPIELRFLYERTVQNLVAEIQSLVNEGCVLICVDYLQPFADKTGKAQDEYLAIKRVSETLRRLALQHKVNLLVASSLNRNERTKKGNGKLTLDSLYGSSGLGHDASVAMILSGKQKDDDELLVPERNVTLSVVKARNDGRGEIKLRYFLSSQRMVEDLPDPKLGFSEQRANNASSS